MIKPTIVLLNFRRSEIYYQIYGQYQYDVLSKQFVSNGLVLVVFNNDLKVKTSHVVTDITECTELKKYLTDD